MHTTVSEMGGLQGCVTRTRKYRRYYIRGRLLHGLETILATSLLTPQEA